MVAGQRYPEAYAGENENCGEEKLQVHTPM
jgi:hypothetical protein